MIDELDDPFADDAKPYVSPVPKCAECGEPQQRTPSGLVCANGHGGADSDASVSNVIYDDETMVTVDEETGEVLGVIGAPPDTWNIKDIAEWLGEKLTWIDGRIAGITAERQSWLNKISTQYDPRLRHFERFKKYLIALYTPIFDTYGRNAVFHEDGSLKTRSKTLKVGLLKINYTTTRARTDVLEQDKAVDLIRREIAWHKEQGNDAAAKALKDAIKVTRSLLKSAIPLDHMVPLEDIEDLELFYTKEQLAEMNKADKWQVPEVTLQSYLEKKGIVHWYEGGEQEFHLG